MLTNPNSHITSWYNLLKVRHMNPSNYHGNNQIHYNKGDWTDFSNLNLDNFIFDNSSIVVTNLDPFDFKVDSVLYKYRGNKDTPI